MTIKEFLNTGFPLNTKVRAKGSSMLMYKKKPVIEGVITGVCLDQALVAISPGNAAEGEEIDQWWFRCENIELIYP